MRWLTRRELLGHAAAPVAAWLAFLATTVAASFIGVSSPRPLSVTLAQSRDVASLIALYGVLAELLVGLPGHVLCRRLGARGATTYACLGVVIGLVPAAVVAILMAQEQHQGLVSAVRADPLFTATALLGLDCGLVAGIAFWSIAVRGTASVTASRR